jgi:hypothetical protein
MASKLRGETFDRLESYIIQILKKEYAGNEKKIRKIFSNLNAYFNLLKQSFGNLDEIKTAE